MTDAQMLTLAIAIILPLSMLLYSNSRITDTKETLRAEIGESKHALRAEMEKLRAEIGETKQTLRAEMAAGFARIENAIVRLETKIVVHELEHHK
jgi:hypothetical protein